MSRDYFIHDALGERCIGEMELPLQIGGKNHASIVLPGAPDQQISAYIALFDGHAYLQPANDQSAVFLNDERLTDSAWLKSGDRIQINEARISWTVRGDKVLIEVNQQPGENKLQPPLQPPPDSISVTNNEMPVPMHEPPSGSAGKRARGWLYSLVGLLFLAALYLIISTPVVIQLKPEAESLKMRGFPPPVPLWGSHLSLPGHYTIEAYRKGYNPIIEEVDISMDGTTTLNYAFTELPGLLEIIPNPNRPVQLHVNGIEVVVDSESRAEISRGSHQIKLETARYLPHEQQIEVEGFGRIQRLEIDLTPAWASISISSQPESAEVHIDGELVGLTPLKVDMLQGRHTIELVREGFKPARITQDIEAGRDQVLEPIQLQVVDGELAITSQPSGASVTLNGAFRGTTPVTLTLEANREHSLSLSKAGFLLEEQKISIKPDETHSLKFKLQPEYATIFLTTHPADTALHIDGNPVKEQNGRLRLSVQPHTLTVSKAGYVTYKQTITPRKGVSQNIEIKLERAKTPAEAEISPSLPAVITTSIGQSLQLIRPDSILNMGASRREAGRRANESRRQVQLKRPFYFAHRETTNLEYRLYKATHNSGSLDNADLNGDSQPVVSVSWDDAARFCNWLSKQQGLPAAYSEQNGKLRTSHPMNTGYRLPSEAEWAWVARKLGQTTEQRYPWAGTYPPAAASGNYADARIADTLADVVPAYDDGFRGTAAVASFPARPRGFYDLGGNVSEWINDYYALYPGQAMQLVTDPTGPVSATHHVVRGAGWRHGNITELRLSFRDYSHKPRHDLGFRIARYAE